MKDKEIVDLITEYVEDHKKHFDSYPMDVEVGDKVYRYDEYWKVLDSVGGLKTN